MRTRDAELMERWQGGDITAFEELVRRWQQPVARFLCRLIGQTEPAADLCQEVFLRVFLAGPRYHENGAFSPWLYRIALNVGRDSLRRSRHPVQQLVSQEVADPSASADTLCQQQELTEIVTEALAELPEPLRIVLILRHYEHQSFEDIARLTGTPASTLKSRFAAALGRLRVRLQQLGWGPEENKP